MLDIFMTQKKLLALLPSPPIDSALSLHYLWSSARWHQCNAMLQQIMILGTEDQARKHLLLVYCAGSVDVTYACC